MYYTLEFDGSFDGRGYWGFRLTAPDGAAYDEAGEVEANGSAQAEWEALIQGLNYYRKVWSPGDTLVIRGDADAVTGALRGTHPPLKDWSRACKEYAMQLLVGVRYYSVWIPREQNKDAHSIVTKRRKIANTTNNTMDKELANYEANS